MKWQEYMINNKMILVKFVGCPNTLCSKNIWTVNNLKNKKSALSIFWGKKKSISSYFFSQLET